MKGATHAFTGFRNGFIGHADDIEGGKAAARIAFNCDQAPIIAVGNSGVNFCNHGESVA